MMDDPRTDVFCEGCIRTFDYFGGMRILLLPALLLVAACQSEQPAPPSKNSDHTNIVLILTDDQGYADVGVYGAAGFKTPNLDALAANGVRMTHHYATQAVCSASRASILTGLYPNRIDMHGALFPQSERGIDTALTTLPELLRRRGYATGMFGKWHLGDLPPHLPLQNGFDEWYGIPYSNDMWPTHPSNDYFKFYALPVFENDRVVDSIHTDQSNLTTELTERSVDFIHRHRKEPFFLYVPHPQPHVPLFVSDKFRGKSARGLYGDVIMELDWSVGQIMEALDENGLTDNTLVIFTSDNGPWLAYGDHAGSTGGLREGKQTTFEGGQREPFLVSYPGKLPPGRVVDVPTMGIDLLPTLAGVAGAELPAAYPLDGKDIWQVWTGESNQSPQEAYFFYYNRNELRGVRSGEWKLHFPHTYNSMEGRPGGSDGLPAETEQRTLTEVHLYHLINDPNETTNVAQEHPEVVARLSTLAEEMRADLGDDLIQAE